MYCHTHCCFGCPWCRPYYVAPTPMHWCAFCNRYTSAWHRHEVFTPPQPIYVHHRPNPGAAALRDQQAINALAGGPRRSA